jgi:hypothetical protein
VVQTGATERVRHAIKITLWPDWSDAVRRHGSEDFGLKPFDVPDVKERRAPATGERPPTLAREECHAGEKGNAWQWKSFLVATGLY